MFVLFEGIDTTGKTTQIEMLKNAYPDMIATYEPGNTKLGAELRAILLGKELHIGKNTELLLFLADRAEHYDKVIAPNKNRLVISDRGFISGIAYALTNDPSIDINLLIDMNRLALGGNLPQKIVFLKTNKELLCSRMNAKSSDKIELRGAEYLLRVQENMEKALNYLDVKRIVLDAAQSKGSLHRKIKRFLDD